jgi:hypothetical protein
MCLKEMYSKIPIDKHLSDNFPIQKHTDTLTDASKEVGLEVSPEGRTKS